VLVKAHRHGSGSGVIWSPDGRVITNAHVVEDAGNSRAVEVELWDGRQLTARIVRRDRRADVAMLQVEASGLPCASPGNAQALRVGELVIAVGNPLGFTGAASTGVVHGVTRESRGRSWVVSQLRLAPGNSGGPLANARGEVVGINTMVSGALAFAIPSDRVMEFSEAPANVQSGFGVVVRPVYMGSNQELGLAVLEVIPGSAAENVSLLQGDILMGSGGNRFRSVRDLEAAIRVCGDGVLKLQFRRGASENIRQVSVVITPVRVRAA
jgi:serine protease Do